MLYMYTVQLTCAMYFSSFTAFHCKRLFPPANGRVVHRGITPGSIAAYTCNQGYMLEGGNEFRQCREGTGWTGSAPTCKGWKNNKLEEVHMHDFQVALSSGSYAWTEPGVLQ